MIDIYNLKQYPGEPVQTFLKRWRKKFSLYARPIPETENNENTNNTQNKTQTDLQAQEQAEAFSGGVQQQNTAVATQQHCAGGQQLQSVWVQQGEDHSGPSCLC